MDWWSRIWRSWHFTPCRLRRNWTASERTLPSVSPEMWYDIATGTRHKCTLRCTEHLDLLHILWYTVQYTWLETFRCDSCVFVCVQVCGNSDGGLGSAVDGLSFSEHQALCGKLLTHGGQIAGVKRARFTSAGHQFGKCVRATEAIKGVANLSSRPRRKKGAREIKLEDDKRLWLCHLCYVAFFGSRLNYPSVFIPIALMWGFWAENNNWISAACGWWQIFFQPKINNKKTSTLYIKYCFAICN